MPSHRPSHRPSLRPSHRRCPECSSPPLAPTVGGCTRPHCRGHLLRDLDALGVALHQKIRPGGVSRQRQYATRRIPHLLAEMGGHDFRCVKRAVHACQEIWSCGALLGPREHHIAYYSNGPVAGVCVAPTVTNFKMLRRACVDVEVLYQVDARIDSGARA